MTTATSPMIGKSHTVSRVFDAPRDLVWKANTEPERMAQWFAPKGFTAFVKRMDFRPEGICHYGQRSANGGMTMWGRVIYKEITPQDRLVYIQSFSDEHGDISTHPLAPTWPKEMHSTVTFEDLGNGKTRMSVTWAPYRPTAEEQATFDNAVAGVAEGWKGTFDHLAAYLAEDERALTIVRTFDAPAHRVFHAYSNADALKQWFGPKGWPLTLCEVDFRQGGSFRFAMTGPDGQQGTPFGGEYLEIVPNKRIVFSNGFFLPDAERMVVTVDLEEMGQRTQLTMRTVFASVAMAKEHLGHGFEQGTNSGFDNLKAYLATSN